MKLNPHKLRDAFISLQKQKTLGRKTSRTKPSVLSYDYIVLILLERSLYGILNLCKAGSANETPTALDLGCNESPYKQSVHEQGYALRTLDLTTEYGADYAGTVENTGLPTGSFELVVCTEVLEHSDDPFKGTREICRILKPGGYAILSTPHVWFYHPHPHDHWRFTQEGMTKLCELAGLKVIELHSRGGSIACLFQIINFMTFGILGRRGAPVYLVCNFIGIQLDQLFPNSLFCLGFSCLAQKDPA